MNAILKKHGTKLVVPAYMIFYMISFEILEKRPMHGFHVIYCMLDQYIPFCEFFIIPYVMWFAFVALTVGYFVFLNRDQKECWQLLLNLGIGMTLFIIISWVYPNRHFLRPILFSRDNICIDIVKHLYAIDTPSNVFPSIHVYNSVACFIAINRCKAFKSHKKFRIGCGVLSLLIIMSTVFLKQHTFVDVIGAFVLNLIVYTIIYKFAEEREPLTQGLLYKQKRSC